MIITPATLQALMTSFRAEYQKGLGMADSVYLKIATEITSSSKSNTYGWLGRFPKFREWVGERQLRDMATHGYQIQNKLFESTVGVPRAEIEDDEIGVYAPLFQEMGRATEAYPDEHVFTLLKQADKTACYDKQNFFDAEHPVFPNVDGTGKVTLVSNLLEGEEPAWYLLDCSRAIKPLIFQRRTKPAFTHMVKEDDEKVFMRDEYRYGVRARSNTGFGFWQMAYMAKTELTPETFNEVYARMSELKGDGGQPLGIRPTHLLVRPSLRAQALEVVKAERLANGASNINANLVQVLDTPWLA